VSATSGDEVVAIAALDGLGHPAAADQVVAAARVDAGRQWCSRTIGQCAQVAVVLALAVVGFEDEGAALASGYDVCLLLVMFYMHLLGILYNSRYLHSSR
jgi:hypothetical protein